MVTYFLPKVSQTLKIRKRFLTSVAIDQRKNSTENFDMHIVTIELNNRKTLLLKNEK